MKPMEGHGGPIFYYAIVLALGFIPWSVFLLPTCVQAWRDRRRAFAARIASDARTWIGRIIDAVMIPESATEADHARAFLWGWIAIYLVAFTIAATKLPNYILPIYPAVALLTADMLERWRRGAITLPRWMFALSVSCVALAGIGMAVGLLVVSGGIDVPSLRARRIPDLQAWALLGLIPLVGAGVGAWCLHRERRTGLIGALALGSCLVLVPLGAWGGAALDSVKAPRPLAALIRETQSEREIRIAAYGYFQPSLVFYCRRHVATLENDADVQRFLQTPLQVFLIMPQATWERINTQTGGVYRVLGQQRDMYRGCDVVLISNRS
jgi:4-amino-4-deoxy-L-arabinose transferase-like glycosyltransferase